MRRALLLLAGPACICVALLTAWLFELSLEHVLVLAPVIVLVTAGVIALLVLWTKAALDGLHGRDD